MNISIKDMKFCIQEWFAQAQTPEQLREIYYSVRNETDKQFDFMFNEIVGENNA